MQIPMIYLKRTLAGFFFCMLCALPAVVYAVTEQAAVEPAPQATTVETVDLTVKPDNVWQRIRNGFGMPNLDNSLVIEQQNWYLARPDYLKRVVQRSRPYLYHIVEELEKRGLPTEIALLPIVESAYNPMAYSPARASGIWQFIPSTGKDYRLEQNWWIDKRRDILASTSAALDYLQSIYTLHGDWQLALASYNWGEGAVARAIARNKAKGLPTNYQSLSMPAETRAYVPKLQALKNIIAQPQLFGIDLEAIPNQPYFSSVNIVGDIDVALAARLAEMSVPAFVALNPAYNRPVIRAEKNSQIILPQDKVELFRSNLEAHDTPLVSWKTYLLKKGEKLRTVASRFNIKLSQLMQVNSVNKHEKLATGHSLLVPTQGMTTTGAAVAAVGKQRQHLVAAKVPKRTRIARHVSHKKKSHSIHLATRRSTKRAKL